MVSVAAVTVYFTPLLSTIWVLLALARVTARLAPVAAAMKVITRPLLSRISVPLRPLSRPEPLFPAIL